MSVPSRVVFREDERERIVRIESPEGLPMPIKSLRCDHPGVQVQACAADKNQFVVTRIPGVDSKPSFAEVAIETENSSRVTVPVVLPQAVKVPQ